MKKYLSIIIGCFLISIAYTIFFSPYNLVPGGILGLGSLFYFVYDLDAVLFIAVSNIVLLLISLPVLGIKRTEKYLLSSFLIPTFIYLTSKLYVYAYFENMEMIIIAVVGAVITGLGYNLLYKEGYSIGGFEIIQDILNNASIKENKFLSYFIDLLVVLGTFLVFGLESAIYSLIIIAVIIYLSTKTRMGIGANRTFYIITNKEAEIKDYLVNDLKYDYTLLDAKGGYTNKKSKIIMTVIDTKDYFRLKEGIAIIDPEAFITIIDNYESINKNVTLNKKPK